MQYISSAFRQSVTACLPSRWITVGLLPGGGDAGLISPGVTPSIDQPATKVSSEYVIAPADPLTSVIDHLSGVSNDSVPVECDRGEASEPIAIRHRGQMTLSDLMIATKGGAEYPAATATSIGLTYRTVNQPTTEVRLSDFIKDGDITQIIAMSPRTLIVPPPAF